MRYYLVFVKRQGWITEADQGEALKFNDNRSKAKMFPWFDTRIPFFRRKGYRVREVLDG